MNRRNFITLIGASAVSATLPYLQPEESVPRVAVILYADGRSDAKKCVSQEAAIRWLHARYRSGDVVEIHPEGIVADGYLRRARGRLTNSTQVES